jgi:phosphohistidine phosphatase SixA
VMLVSHSPFLGEITTYLLTGASRGFPIVNYHPASVACLSNDEGFWMIEWVQCT